HGFELATFSASNLIYRKEQMLAPAPAHMGANLVFANMEADGIVPFGATPLGFYVNATNPANIQFLNDEGLFGGKSGAEKKDAAMSFLESALATVDAVAQREIVDPERFKSGVSKIIDGTVDCLNASTWAKQNSSAPGVSQ